MIISYYYPVHTRANAVLPGYFADNSCNYITYEMRNKNMWIADQWKDYEVLDTSSGEKLERWGDYLLVRPDPQVIWNTPRKNPGWKKKNGHYHRSSKGGGEWEFSICPRNGASITAN